MTGTGGSGPLAALIGQSLASDNTPVASAPPAHPKPKKAPRPPARESASPASRKRSYGPEPAPETAPEPAPAPAPKKPAEAPAEAEPETGPVKHVFVISLASPGYEQSLGAQSQMPYLSATLRPQGELLSNYTLLGEGPLANGIAAISGQPPNTATNAGCPTHEEFSSSQGELERGRRRLRLRLPGRNPDPGRPAHARQAQLARLRRRHGRPDREAVQLRISQPRRRQRRGSAGRLRGEPEPVRLLPLAARPRRLLGKRRPAGTAEQGPRQSRQDAQLLVHRADPCNAGTPASAPQGRPKGPASADAFLSAWVPKILASPAYKADGLLIVTFSATNPPVAGGAGPEPETRCAPAPCCSRSSPPRAAPMPAPTTLTRCCAPARNSSR